MYQELSSCLGGGGHPFVSTFGSLIWAFKFRPSSTGPDNHLFSRGFQFIWPPFPIQHISINDKGVTYPVYCSCWCSHLGVELRMYSNLPRCLLWGWHRTHAVLSTCISLIIDKGHFVRKLSIQHSTSTDSLILEFSWGCWFIPASLKAHFPQGWWLMIRWNSRWSRAQLRVVI